MCFGGSTTWDGSICRAHGVHRCGDGVWKLRLGRRRGRCLRLVRWISNPLHFSSSAEQAMWNESGCGTSTSNATTTSATVCRWVHTSNIFVTVAGEPMACLSFAGAAWRVEARDRWIGWNGEQRERNLRYIVNNTRFVIFPWVQVRNVASRLLALAAKRIGADWHRLYAYEPLLLETFVDAERYAGTCYRAANWLLVGYTKGRGKLDRQFKANLSKKAVLLYPLTKDATRRLRA